MSFAIFNVLMAAVLLMAASIRGAPFFVIPPSFPNTNTLYIKLVNLPTNSVPTIFITTNLNALSGNWVPIFTGRVGQASINLPRNRFPLALIKASYTPANPADSIAYTNLAFESFEGVGNLNSNSPGGMGTITVGTLYKRAVGPRRDECDIHGWSADMREPFSSYFNLGDPKYGAAAKTGALGFWVRFSDFGTATYPNHYAQVARITTQADDFLLGIGVNKTGRVYVADTTSIVTPTSLKLHTWYYFLLEYQNTSITKVSYRFSVMPLGQPLQIVQERTPYDPGSLRQFQRVYVMDQQNGSGGIWYGRLGSVALQALQAIGQADLSSGSFPPIETPRKWYVNPATGDDNNTGLSPNQAWASAEKLTAEMTFSGVLGTLTPWRWTSGEPFPVNATKQAFLDAVSRDLLVPNGDTVLIETTAAPLNITTQLLVGTRIPGLHITSASSNLAELSCFKSISPASWLKVPGYEYIYQTSDTEPYSVLWEDRKWMNHATGSLFSAVAPYLDINPGAFWTDGTNLFVHPFESTSPTQDGKSYERSRLLGGVANQGMNVTGADCQLSRLRIGGTTLVNHTVNDSPPGVNHYGLQAFAKNNVVKDCDFYYGSKHCFGVLGGSDNKSIYVKNVRCEQASRYVGYGGQTVYVVYADSSTNMTALFKHCSTFMNQGAIGSVSGEISLNNVAFYSHAQTGNATFQWEDVIIDDCNFPGLQFGQGDNAIMNGFTIKSTRFGNGYFKKALIDRCHIDLLNAVPIAGGRVTIRNSILTPTSTPGAAQFTGRIQGDYTVEGCTIDLSQNSGNGTVALFSRYAPLNFIYRNNIFVGKPGQNFAILSSATSGDSLTFNNNIYKLGALQKVLLNYNDGTLTSDRTFAQWQASGSDRDSMVADPMVDSNYKPLSGSPVIDAGVELGTSTDYSGILLQQRNDIGAYEFLP